MSGQPACNEFSPYAIDEGLIALWVPSETSSDFAAFLIGELIGFDFDPATLGGRTLGPNRLFTLSDESVESVGALVARFRARAAPT